MTNFELCLIVCALLMPIVAFIFVNPKSTKEKITTKAKKEQPKSLENPNIEEKPKPKPEKKKPVFEPVECSPDEFKGYLEKKHENVSKPKEKFIEHDAGISIDEFISHRRPLNMDKQETNSLEDLSPELKAMLMVGILDRKHFD